MGREVDSEVGCDPDPNASKSFDDLHYARHGNYFSFCFDWKSTRQCQLSFFFFI